MRGVWEQHLGHNVVELVALPFFGHRLIRAMTFGNRCHACALRQSMPEKMHSAITCLSQPQRAKTDRADEDQTERPDDVQIEPAFAQELNTQPAVDGKRDNAA